MKKYAIVLDGTVIDVITWAQNTPVGLPKFGSFAVIGPSDVEAGWSYIDGVFAPPIAIMAEPKATKKKK